jgi:hypothetical protein
MLRFANDFDHSRHGAVTQTVIGDRRGICESYDSVDIRELYRDGRSPLKWPAASWPDRTKADAIMLPLQCVSVVWTRCPFGGSRPWFVCPTPDCGRRVAKLYGGEEFACRHCHGLVYASQRQGPTGRGIRRAQKIRMRLGGTSDLTKPFPQKPRGMHWRTYNRLRERATTAERRSYELLIRHLMRWRE